MKRGLTLLFIVILLFLILSFILVSAQQETTKIKRAYSWLKTNSLGKWQNLNTEQHVFSLLALQGELSSLQQEASIRKLMEKSYENGTCWPQTCNVKETALAKLALDSIDTDFNSDKASEWLLNQTMLPSGIDWYLQLIQPTEETSRCLLFYNGCDSGCEVDIDKEGKISGNLGNCFTNAEYWLKLNENCMDQTFNVTCNTSIDASFLFKKGSDWYVTGQLESAQAQGEPLSIKLEALCVGIGSCDYEASLWTAYAFFKDGQLNTAKLFLPYLIMNYEDNLQYLPQAFLYAITNKGSFLSELSALQRNDGLWLASSDKYHDTGLTLWLTQAMAGNVTKAKETLLDEQKFPEGYWQCSGCDKQIDTALILLGAWPTLEYYSECEAQGYYCVANCSNSGGTLQPYSCFSGECCDVAQLCEERWGECKTSCGTNQTQVPYVCDSGICCKDYDKSLCISEIGGQICGTGQVCLNSQGNIIPLITSSEGAVCCLGTCTSASETCSDLGGEHCDVNTKSCQAGHWLNAIDDDYCCESGYCTDQMLTCSALGGDICSSDEDCKNGILVEAANTGGQETCCVQGGTCIPISCDAINGIECEAGESCSGTMYETMDVQKCCVNGECLKSCSSLGGNVCNSSLACDGTIVEAFDSQRCCIGTCKKPKVFPWLTLIIIFLVLGLAAIIFLFIRKKRKAKPAKPKLEFPGMMPIRRMPPRTRAMPPRGIPPRGIPVRKPVKPIAKKPSAKPITRKPKPKAKPLPPVPKPS